MYAARVSWLFLLVALFAAGCSRTPTSPSSSAPAVPMASAPQTAIPVPPRASVTVPDAIGLTRFVAFGDSITWGAESAWSVDFFFAAASGGYPERLVAGLNTYHAPQVFTVINEGLPGETVTSALSRFQSMLTNRRPQAVLLLEGVNDLNGGKTVAETISGVRALLDAAELRGVPVLLATMFQTYAVTDPDGNPRPNAADLIVPYNTELKKLPAGRPNVRIVDLYPVMDDRRFVGKDGLHNTPEGFEVMATTFLDAIENAFPVRGNVQ